MWNKKEEWRYMLDDEKLEYLHDKLEDIENIAYDSVSVEDLEIVTEEQNKRLNNKVRVLARENRELRKHIGILYLRLEQLKDDLLQTKKRLRACEELASML